MTTTIESILIVPFTDAVTATSRESVLPGQTYLLTDVFVRVPPTQTEEVTVLNVNDTKTVIKAGESTVELIGDGQFVDFCAKSDLPLGTTGFRVTNTRPLSSTEC